MADINYHWWRVVDVDARADILKLFLMQEYGMVGLVSLKKYIYISVAQKVWNALVSLWI